MKVRFLFRDYEISSVSQQHILYGVAVLISILSVFSIIFMLSYYSEDPVDAQFPSPTPGVFSALTAAEQQRALQQQRQQQVQGLQKQQQVQPQSDTGPTRPSPKPSPSPSPSPIPSPSAAASPTPTPTPESSPSPNSTSTPNPTPDNRPKITNINESDKTETSIKLKFSVDKNSDCKASYWTDPNSKKEQESSTKRTTSPEVSISGLTAATEYTYLITCKDADSDATATAGEYKFKTN